MTAPACCSCWLFALAAPAVVTWTIVNGTSTAAAASPAAAAPFLIRGFFNLGSYFRVRRFADTTCLGAPCSPTVPGRGGDLSPSARLASLLAFEIPSAPLSGTRLLCAVRRPYVLPVPRAE